MLQKPVTSRLSTALLTGALLCVFQPSLRADVTATLLGTVRDSSGSVLPTAKVTVSNLETNLTRSMLTDTNGEFRFLSLPVGTYNVEAELNGFQTFVTSGIVLTSTSSFARISRSR